MSGAGVAACRAFGKERISRARQPPQPQTTQGGQMLGKDVNVEWAVFVSKTRARVFRLPTSQTDTQELADFVNLDGRMREAELQSDAPGQGMGGNGAPHGLGEGASRKDESLRRFLKDVGEHLERGRNEGRFARLHLVAEPRTLGALRKALAPGVRDLVGKTIRKDLTAVDSADVARLIAEG
jgi:protein required for attachment to host cells